MAETLDSFSIFRKRDGWEISAKDLLFPFSRIIREIGRLIAESRMIDGRDPSVNLQSLKFLFAFVRGGKKGCFETERERDGNFVRSRQTGGTKRGKGARHRDIKRLFPGISCDGGRDFCFGDGPPRENLARRLCWVSKSERRLEGTVGNHRKNRIGRDTRLFFNNEKFGSKRARPFLLSPPRAPYFYISLIFPRLLLCYISPTVPIDSRFSLFKFIEFSLRRDLLDDAEAVPTPSAIKQERKSGKRGRDSRDEITAGL